MNKILAHSIAVVRCLMYPFDVDHHLLGVHQLFAHQSYVVSSQEFHDHMGHYLTYLYEHRAEKEKTVRAMKIMPEWRLEDSASVQKLKHLHVQSIHKSKAKEVFLRRAKLNEIKHFVKSYE